MTLNNDSANVGFENQIEALTNMINRPMPTDPYTPEQAKKILDEKLKERDEE